MNYRDFYKSKSDWKKYLYLLPEGVDPKEFEMGFSDEYEEHPQVGPKGAAKIAAQHLSKNPKHYSISKKAGLEEKELIKGINLEDNSCCDGLPKREDGALDIEHNGRPIRLSKIVQIGGEFASGKPATGELGGYTAIGGERTGHSDSVDAGGLEVKQDGDKEPITAGGKAVDSSLASKTVGDKVVPGEGQEQGGPNTKGCIAGTHKLEGGDKGGETLTLQEARLKLKKVVKDVLKEITFDKETGKWVRLDEGGHKKGCTCGFCKNKGNFGKKKKEDDKEDKKEDKKDKKDDKKKDEIDENVDMKMGPSYKVAPNPSLQTPGNQDLPRIQAYEPEITEMVDDEEESMMKERYESLANAQRNLSESELQELKDLGMKIENMEMKMGPSYKADVKTYRCADCDPARTAQFDPQISEVGEEEQEEAGLTSEAGGAAVQHSSGRAGEDNYPTHTKNRHRGDID